MTVLPHPSPHVYKNTYWVFSKLTTYLSISCIGSYTWTASAAVGKRILVQINIAIDSTLSSIGISRFQLERFVSPFRVRLGESHLWFIFFSKSAAPVLDHDFLISSRIKRACYYPRAFTRQARRTHEPRMRESPRSLLKDPSGTHWQQN